MGAHTTLTIDKVTHKKVIRRARRQRLSVSAVTRMLLHAYVEGRINLMAVQVDPPVEVGQLSEEEITPEMREALERGKKTPLSEYISI